MAEHGTYYVPAHSSRPITSAIGLFFLGLGSIFLTENPHVGFVLLGVGGLILGLTLIFWFRDVILENRKGLHDAQMDRTYRWGMFWYMFSQLMLVGTFFGALLFIRVFSIPGMAGMRDDASQLTHLLLWPNFSGGWPLLQNPNPTEYLGPHAIMTAWGWPAINTLIIALSVIFVLVAGSVLKRERYTLFSGLVLSLFLLTVTISVIQIVSLMSAVGHYGITLGSGIYGSTFVLINFLMLLNMVASAIILAVLTPRSFARHFTSKQHFAIDAATWMWLMIAGLWLLTFIYVYWF